MFAVFEVRRGYAVLEERVYAAFDSEERPACAVFEERGYAAFEERPIFEMVLWLVLCSIHSDTFLRLVSLATCSSSSACFFLRSASSCGVIPLMRIKAKLRSSIARDISSSEEGK